MSNPIDLAILASDVSAGEKPVSDAQEPPIPAGSIATILPPTPNPEPNFVPTQSDPFKIEWKGSPNFWSGRAGHTAVAICDHIMQGSMESTNGWFKSRRSEASTHFGVAHDGRIYQWVQVEDTAWGNGILQNPDTSLGWLADCQSQNINPNSVTISIEHEGYSGKPFPEEQFQATLWLHRYLCSHYNIAFDRQYIVGHYQIMARDRAGCPGPTFPWERLMQELNNRKPQTQIQPAPTPAPPPDEPKPAPSSNKWTDGVPGVVMVDFGPGTVNSNNAYVRNRPSISTTDKTLLRTVSRGKVIRFAAYTDAGPVFHNGVRWYLIADEDGGGWIHSIMIN